MKVETNSVRTRMCQLTMWACTALALGVCGAAQGQQPIAIGPYVQNVGSGNAIICWATLSGEVTIAPPAHRDTSFREYQIHSVVLRGLKPGTTYTYSVPGDTGNTSLCSFTTCADEKRPFSFCVISDTQNRENQAHRLAIERMMADKPDMLFNCGDLVADGRNIGDWEEFFRAEGDLLRGAPCYAVLGNHDRESPWYFRFFALPGNERYDSFNRGVAVVKKLMLRDKLVGKTAAEIGRDEKYRSPLFMLRQRATGNLVRVYDVSKFTDRLGARYCVMRFDAADRCESVPIPGVAASKKQNPA